MTSRITTLQMKAIDALPYTGSKNHQNVDMPESWNPSLYRTHDVQTPAPAPEAVDNLTQAVNTCSTRLQSDPYNPELWTERAGHYLQLNYPELAVGDAYRAKLLFDRLDSAPDDHGESSKSEKNGVGQEGIGTDEEVRVKAYTILGQALYDCHCHWECFEFWLSLTQAKQFPQISRIAFTKANALKQLLAQKKQAAAPYGGTQQQQRDRLRDGSVVSVHYPWMEKRHLTRSPEVVRQVNSELKANVQPPACRLSNSTLAPIPDMLGIFATRPISKGSCILIDQTTTSAASSPPSSPHCENCYDTPLTSPVLASCCASLFCSPTCHSLAMNTYHRALCGQNFSWLSAPASSLRENASPMRPLLLLRFLALCVQAGVQKHPLDHPLIARLQPLANCGHLDVFTLGESVVTPLKILQQLGINIFTTPAFSTMVLHTIWCRLANNKAGSFDPKLGFVDEITPFLPLFNHSCEPNVEYKKEDGTNTIRFFALRNIEEGEEIFDSYQDVEDLRREERVERMWPWFEQPCLCPRCRREAAQGR
ncbi:hypothetical protein BU25DRAFT_409948 [Macroventuria anomochaeta]|uniref:Uncharacterized protein n=1 Tax=Macroventuria anomochaeta TaxID=301207 RepID=A0ACB6S2Y0_9PLEO|nr:uncharacterized protein BU25DRAFT_409948 [Macroventuria anomochaeta]KAF2628384.1 hypothetical protein BU25DRAFT_409948 [Macroventuria anomochaeta]